MIKLNRVVFLGIRFLIIVVPIVAYILITYVINKQQFKKKNLNFNDIKVMQLIVKSQYFSNGEFIPTQFTCEGKDVFPTIEVKNIPSNAKNLVLYVEDPDAPMSRSFIHLMAVNISVNSGNKIIDQDVVNNEAILGINDFGKLGWNGPCPPHLHGVHHYYFKVLAFDGELPLNTGFDIANFEKTISSYQGHIVGKGELVGLYQR